MGLNYTKTNWLARLGTKLNRFSMTHESNNSTEYVTLLNSPSSVTQVGTQFTASRMNNIENFLSALDDKVLTANVTLYVDRINGSDSNSGTSSSAGLKHLQAAIDLLPPNLGGYAVTINVTGGTSDLIDPAVTINAKHGGRINITGEQHIRSLTIGNCERVYFTDDVYLWPSNATDYDSGLSVSNSLVQFNGDLRVQGAVANYGIYAVYGAIINVANTAYVTFNTAQQRTAIFSFGDSLVSFNAATIDTTYRGLQASRGGVIAGGSYTISNISDASQNTYTSTGGRIHMGRQLDFANSVLTENITLYVSPATGNDSNDGLTLETAKKTLNGALALIPKNLGGHTATIQCSSSVKDVAASINNFQGGTIQLVGESYHTRSLSISNSSRVSLSVDVLTIEPVSSSETDSALTISAGSNVLIPSSTAVEITGNYASYAVLVQTAGVLTSLSNTAGGVRIAHNSAVNRTAVRTASNGQVYFTMITITNVANGFSAIQGSRIAHGTLNQTGVTTLYATLAGGRIYAGAQTSMPNY